MKYSSVIEAKFIDRPNRFIAHVEINGAREVVHVKNTGRCKELLVPGAKVYLSVADNLERKTKYDLIAVEKTIKENKSNLINNSGNTLSTMLVNMDSQVPNNVAAEWLKNSKLFSEKAIIKREFTYKNSRFDIYVEDGSRKAFIEVKGVTLEFDGIASFPDAPTERGVKHIQELQASLNDGYEAYIIFVIQMKPIKYLIPNDITHKAFGDTLRVAKKAGVKVLAVDCLIQPDSIEADQMIEVRV